MNLVSPNSRSTTSPKASTNNKPKPADISPSEAPRNRKRASKHKLWESSALSQTTRHDAPVTGVLAQQLTPQLRTVQKAANETVLMPTLLAVFILSLGMRLEREEMGLVKAEMYWVGILGVVGVAVMTKRMKGDSGGGRLME